MPVSADSGAIVVVFDDATELLAELQGLQIDLADERFQQLSPS